MVIARKREERGGPFNSFLFRKPQDEALYLKSYDAVFSGFHLQPEEITVPTRFGFTHVNAFGSKGAPNLVLLHGMEASSTMWAPNIAAFCRHFRVYAPDTMGDLGKSRCTRRPRSGRDYAQWLKRTFDGLNLEKACVIGVSYGGWIAFHFAMCAPERTEKIISIAPAATFQRVCLQFFMRTIPILLVPVKGIKNHLRMSFIRWLSGVPDIRVLEAEPLWRQHLCGVSLAKLRPVVPPGLLNNRELKHIIAPTLLLVGEKEVIYDPQKALERACRTMPNITAELVPGGTHMMSWDQREVINTRIITYLLTGR